MGSEGFTVRTLEQEHLSELGLDPALAVLNPTGFSLFHGEQLVASGGTMDAPWGCEVWILVVPGPSFAEARAILRVARYFVGELLGVADEIWACARPGAARLIHWLGFEYQRTVQDQSGEMADMWRASALEGVPNGV